VPDRWRAVVCNERGLAVFDLLRGYRHDAAAVLCAFDLLELDGEDLRRTPIEERKRILAKLLSDAHKGIAFNEHYTGDGAIIYKHACALGCEGMCRRGWARPTAPAALIAGSRSRTRTAPAVRREAEEDWGK
jgi:bifunctional non-homologous end joining protein LigD